MAKLCSTRWVADHDRHEQPSLPLTCRKGHHWSGGRVTIIWAPCDCSTNEVDPECGHLVVHCGQSMPDQTEQTDAHVLLGALVHEGPRANADRNGSQARGMRST